MVAENMKDYRTATQMLASVPQEVQKQPESIAALAMSYYQLGEKAQAESTLQELQHHPAGERAALLGAQIADEMADYDTAERLLSSLGSNSRDQADLGYRLAAVQYRAGRFEKSVQTLLRLVASGNETGRIFNLLGWCYEKRNQPEQAQRAFEQGISVQPNDESNYLDLQKILVARNRLAAALEVAKRTTDALPNSARAFAMRGSLEMQTSQFSNAVTSYRHAAELDPASIDSALGLADAEFAADMVKEAQTRYEAGIKQFPEDARFRIHYASALLKQGETGDPRAQGRAQELLTSAVKLDPSSADAYVQLGEIALANGQTAEALEDYGKAAKLSPENATAHFGLSKAYHRLGKLEEASRETKLFEKLEQSSYQSPTSLPAENQHN
jgi:tetratricopeptide (TPR) repeat protein